MAKEFNNGIEQAMYATTPPLEALKLLTVELVTRDRERQDVGIAIDDNNSTIMIHVDVRRTQSVLHQMRIHLGEARCVDV